MTTRKPARKKKPTAKEQLPPGRDNETEFEEEIAADVEEFMADQDEAAIVMVYKIGKPGERDGFLDTLSMGAIRSPSCQQVVRDTWGAGSYRLKLKAPDARGVMKWAGAKTITIAEQPKTAVNGHTAGPTDYWREESNKQQQLILALIASQKPQSLDLAGLAALVGTLTGGNKQSDLAGVVAAFTALKSAAEPKDGVEQIKSALELARSINGPAAPAAGDGEGDTSWPGLIRGAISAFTGGMQPPQQQRQLPAGAPGAPAADNNDEPSEEEMWQQWLSGQLGFLKTKAKAGKPVQDWIKYTVENPDEVGNQAIYGALKGGATFEHLLAFDPEIATNAALRVWFQQFYDGLKHSLQPASPIPWIVRDKPDTTDNADPRTTGQPAAGSAPGGGSPGQS